MKPLKRFLDSNRDHFTSGGKLARLYPFYESIETIFFSLDRSTGNGPHMRDSLDVKRFMTMVIISLVPLLFFGIYNTGYQSHRLSGLPLNAFGVFLTGLWIVLPIVLVTYIVGFFWEVLFAVVRKHAISEGLFVSCMLFPLTLPPTIPLWQVAVGISFGIVLGKEVFGGTGRNFLNPALTGRAFLYFAYPAQLSGDPIWAVVSGAKGAAVDAVSGATPLAIAALTDAFKGIESSLAESGYALSVLFFGRYPGSIGATSTLLCLVGAVVLVTLGIANYRIILGGVIGLLSSGWVLNLIAGGGSNPWFVLNPIYHLVMGGFAFGIVFMATDPVSSPDLDGAKWVFGLFIGLLTILIRVFNPAFVEGVMLAILSMNLFAPLLDHVEVKFRLRKRIPNV